MAGRNKIGLMSVKFRATVYRMAGPNAHCRKAQTQERRYLSSRLMRVRRSVLSVMNFFIP
jgi:hypothetical protein